MRTIKDTGFDKSRNGQKAQAIFDERITLTLTQENIGEYLVIDIETGYFALGQTMRQAIASVNVANPDGRERYITQIGYAASTRIGFAPFCRQGPADKNAVPTD
jgi:hypothetical protein